MYSENDYRDYLAHHGIFGMKWGKKNGPPYPIAPGDHSASEKKAGWRKSLAEKREAKRQAKRAEISDAKVKQRREDDAKRAEEEHPESERLQRFKEDMERAKQASTDEEHDRLERIADTRNSLTYRTGLSGKYKWYELSNENAHYLLDDNDDSSIEAVHKVEDNFKNINSACRDAVAKDIREFNDQMRRDGEKNLQQVISFDKPAVRVIPDYDEAIFTIRADGTVPGYYDVEYDLKNKKVTGTSFND